MTVGCRLCRFHTAALGNIVFENSNFLPSIIIVVIVLFLHHCPNPHEMAEHYTSGPQMGLHISSDHAQSTEIFSNQICVKFNLIDV